MSRRRHTISDRSRVAINNIKRGTEFTKDQIAGIVTCNQKSLNFVFSDMVEAGEIYYVERDRKYYYFRKAEINLERDFGPMQKGKKSPMRFKVKASPMDLFLSQAIPA